MGTRHEPVRDTETHKDKAMNAWFSSYGYPVDYD